MEPKPDGGLAERIDYLIEQFAHVAELAAAAIFALLSPSASPISGCGSAR